jgi:tRNA G46 methylase TrmB
MDKEIINILKKHGCLYMAEDYKELLTDIEKHYKQPQSLQLLQPAVIKSVCDRVNNFENNRCINCGAKAGHKCELQTVL